MITSRSPMWPLTVCSDTRSPFLDGLGHGSFRKRAPSITSGHTSGAHANGKDCGGMATDNRWTPGPRAAACLCFRWLVGRFCEFPAGADYRPVGRMRRTGPADSLARQGRRAARQPGRCLTTVNAAARAWRSACGTDPCRSAGDTSGAAYASRPSSTGRAGCDDRVCARVDGR